MNPTAISLNKPFTVHRLPRLPKPSKIGRFRSGTQLRIRSENTNESIKNEMVVVDEQITSPETPGIRFRRVSKKRARQQRQEQEEGKETARKEAAAVKKEWESMNLSEKAMELYVGEKGLLFWLNKFAYASIFIIIGGWILFRFVGPALNIYQLDQPPLSPTTIFKG